MITEVYAYEEAPPSYRASIFLVGPTPRGDDATSWRPEALKSIATIFHQVDIDSLAVFIPEVREGGVYRYLDQVEWEKKHLEMADVLLVWVPRDMKTSLKGLTTNIKFGKYVDSGKLFYGRPENADNIRYLDWLYTSTTTRTPANTLAGVTEEVVNYLQTHLTRCHHQLRQGGERWVPLTIWCNHSFQSWYQSQRRAGNQLVAAKVLWTFMIHKVHFLFSYALHVDVWIAAENRVKSNEFILSRPDISVVVAYWKHPTDWLESEIILIKEFRSPARTPDGFVHELPGGSSFKGGDPLQLASHELQEETSLQIPADRFKYLGSKQIAATWSTHVADVYAIALEKSEMDAARELVQSGQTFGVAEDTEHTYVEICKLKDIGNLVDWSMEGMIYRALFSSE
jgi:ADP-ribose pyrophosphatase YjhB (NUDIX family)